MKINMDVTNRDLVSLLSNFSDSPAHCLTILNKYNSPAVFFFAPEKTLEKALSTTKVCRHFIHIYELVHLLGGQEEFGYFNDH